MHRIIYLVINYFLVRWWYLGHIFILTQMSIHLHTTSDLWNLRRLFGEWDSLFFDADPNSRAGLNPDTAHKNLHPFFKFIFLKKKSWHEFWTIGICVPSTMFLHFFWHLLIHELFSKIYWICLTKQNCQIIFHLFSLIFIISLFQQFRFGF